MKLDQQISYHNRSTCQLTCPRPQLLVSLDGFGTGGSEPGRTFGHAVFLVMFTYLFGGALGGSIGDYLAAGLALLATVLFTAHRSPSTRVWPDSRRRPPQCTGGRGAESSSRDYGCVADGSGCIPHGTLRGSRCR